MKTPKVGMKVKYSHAWLKAVQAEKEIADMEGDTVSKKVSIKDGGYKYVRYSPYYGGHILEDLVTGKWELWVSNKNHSSYGLIYKNTHLEFAQSITDNVPVSFKHLFQRR